MIDAFRFAAGDPSTISGLIRAWRPDSGVTTGIDGITNVAGAWGTSTALTQSGAACPDVGTDLAPDGTDLFDFTAADSEQFVFTTTGGLTAFTAVFVVAPKTQGSAQGILGQAAAGTMYLQLGAAASKVQMRAGGGDTNHDLTLPRDLVKNLEIIAVTYDGTTATPYLDGVVGTGAAIAGQTFTFDKVGALGATSNDLNAYMGPMLIYDRALNAAEVGQLYAYLARWKGSTVYVAAAGSDSSVTPWLQATPLALPSTAIGYAAFNVEVALKGGDVFRQTAAKISTSVSGLSTSQRCKMSGSRWGAGKAQIRFSAAPNVTNTSGTIYSLAGSYTVDTIPAGLNPGTDFGYVYYVPGGAPSFTRVSTTEKTTNVVRLTYQTTTTTPASGKWSFSGTTIYVNAGVALSNGDIEVPVDSIGPPSLVSTFHILNSNWLVENVVLAFAEDRGFVNLDSINVKLYACEVWFCGSDGFDGFEDSVTEHEYCVAYQCGRGPTDASGFGDGYSLHDASQATFYRCEAWYNDKSGCVHQAPSQSWHYGCINIGTMPFRHSDNASQIGSFYMENCIAVVPSGAVYPHGISNTCQADSPLTAYHCTALSLDGTGEGIRQTSAVGTIVARNNIVKGFSTGIAGISGQVSITADHNCLHGNSSNYANVTAGTGDITADPLFVSSPTDLDVQAGSPCLLAGLAVSVANDYAGAARSATAPTIGAYE